MDDRFKINIYSASCLIIIGIGHIISLLLGNPLGTMLAGIGAVGFLFLSKLDKFLIFSIAIWSIGLIFFIQHWSGARIIVMLGGILTLIGLYFRFKKDNFHNYKLIIWISLVLLLIAYNMKLQHIKYNFYVYTFGALCMIISYGLRFSKKNPKNILDYLKLIFIYSILINYLFMLGHYPFYYILNLILILSTLSLGGYSIYLETKNE